MAEAWRPRDEPEVVELRTERLLLRGWVAADRGPFAALNADPEVMEHFPAVLSRGESNALVARIRQHFVKHGYGLWAVEADGEFLGFTGLAWTDVLRSEPEGAPALEVGWRLARSAWGHGYATEAAAAALAYGLTVARRVVSVTATTNSRSQAVMERIGLRRVREFDHPRPDLPEHLRRHVLYAGDGRFTRDSSTHAPTTIRRPTPPATAPSSPAPGSTPRPERPAWTVDLRASAHSVGLDDDLGSSPPRSAR